MIDTETILHYTCDRCYNRFELDKTGRSYKFETPGGEFGEIVTETIELCTTCQTELYSRIKSLTLTSGMRDANGDLKPTIL